MPENRPGEQLYLRGLNRHTLAHYKAYCAKRSLKMKHDLEKYMQKCVEKDNKLSVKHPRAKQSA